MILARLFFWLMLASHVVKDYYVMVTGKTLIEESFFPLIESFQFPIIFFTLLSLYSLGYNKLVLSVKAMRCVGVAYLSNVLYLIVVPVVYYWEQSADVSLELVLFFVTDFVIFWLLWSNKNVNEDDKRAENRVTTR